MTPFENFLFYDSRRETKSSLADAVTILHFTGKVDFSRLKNAIVQTVKHHTTARCIISLKSNGIPEWIPFGIQNHIICKDSSNAPEEIPNLIRITNEEPCYSALPQLQILQEPGIRFWFYTLPDSEQFQIWFQFHHVTTDALGSFRFLEEVFERYADESGNISDEFPTDSELNVEQTSRIPITLSLIWNSILQIVTFPFYRKPRELQSSTTSHSVQSAKPLFRTLTREETQSLLNMVHQQGVSLNDQILTTVFQAVEKFQPDGKPVQIAVPVNIRSEKFLKMPLRNLVSIVFLRASHRILHWSESRLLTWIHRQMQPNRKHTRVTLLLQELKWLCAWHWNGNRRWGMKWFVHRKTPLATLVVSNLGILFRDSRLPRTPNGNLQIGELTLERVEQISPRTTDAALTLAVGTYAGRLHFGLNWDPKRVNRGDAQQFLSWVTDFQALKHP